MSGNFRLDLELSQDRKAPPPPAHPHVRTGLQHHHPVLLRKHDEHPDAACSSDHVLSCQCYQDEESYRFLKGRGDAWARDLVMRAWKGLGGRGGGGGLEHQQCTFADTKFFPACSPLLSGLYLMQHTTSSSSHPGMEEHWESESVPGASRKG